MGTAITALIDSGDVVVAEPRSDRGALGLQPWQSLGFISAVNAFIYEWATATPCPPVSDLVDTLTSLLITLVGIQ